MARNSGGTTAIVAVGAGILGAALANGLGAALGPDFVLRLFFGGLAGAACGLLPYFVGRSRDIAFARKAVWISVGCGIVLGLILAMPVAIVLAVMASRRAPRPATPVAV